MLIELSYQHSGNDLLQSVFVSLILPTVIVILKFWSSLHVIDLFIVISKGGK